MSTRQLKKLHKQQELARLQNLAKEEDDSSEEDVAPPKPRTSAFAGFAALGDADDDDDDDEKPEENEDEEKEPEPAVPVPTPAKKSKKSKKKKAKAKKATSATPGDNNESPQPDGLDEIDLALKELNMAKASQGADNQNTQGAYDAKLARLLSISFDHLKVINELRAMFGQDTLNSVRNQDEAQARDDRRHNRHGAQRQMQVDMEMYLKGRPGEKIPEVVRRKNPFVQGKEEWPKASAGGLKMEAVTDERVDPTEYRFSHDKHYQELEVGFFSLVDMMDPMRIVHFVHQNPYHVNALIQTSRVARQDHNAALAGDLCERALFTFGRVTLSSFRKKLERGLARLDFRRPENRQFWLAGYHYIKSLMQKGTYDTALEWTKIYLSISPNDEYAMMNFTHVLAIHAREAEWFIALCNSVYFNSDEYDLPMKEYHRQTCVLAKLQMGDKEGALRDLVKGMETLPWLYSAICSAVNIDTPRSIWGVQPRDDDDTLYTELYIHMAKDIWKRDGTDLLKEAGELAQKVDVHSLPSARRVPLSIGRFIYLDNTPELMGLVPSEMLHASPNFDYDPLPPPREENIFSNEWQSIPWRRGEGGPQSIRDPAMEALLEAERALIRRRREAQGLEGADEPGEDDEAAEAEDGVATGGGVMAALRRLLRPIWTQDGEDQYQEGDDPALDYMLRTAAQPGGYVNPWSEDEEDNDGLPADTYDDDMPGSENGQQNGQESGQQNR